MKGPNDDLNVYITRGGDKRPQTKLINKLKAS